MAGAATAPAIMIQAASVLPITIPPAPVYASAMPARE
jgi:hypothetical protein